MRRIPFLLLIFNVACRSDKDSSVDTGPADTTPAAVDADSDGYTADEDCDDSDGNANPGAVELCDGVDNNCDGAIDEGVTETFYADRDSDGFGDPLDSTDACDAPGGYVEVPNDCDDADPDTYSGAPERCDEADNDCDGDIDEDVQTDWYLDADSDGYGGDGVIADCNPPSGYVDNSDDCNDLSGDAYPDAAEICDEIDNDCDGSTDEDVASTFYRDADADGFGDSGATTDACVRPTGYASTAGDCDDSDAQISPNAAELCDGADNDCDGDTDEDDAADAATWYADDDGDAYGDVADSTVACDQPSGYVRDDSDCDDTSADANPGEAEVCDGADNDCDGEADEDSATDAETWHADSDGDGYGGTSSTTACDQPAGFADNSDDCDDGDDGSHPGASEVCDEADNDCDGDTDEGVTTTYYADADSDGQGDASSTTEACSPPSGYVSTSDDCDDSDAGVSPNAREVCDDVDNDCDGSIDEDAYDVALWYADSDGDSYGDASSTAEDCDQPSGYVANAEDCDDSDGAISPSAEEVCDEVDNDCDGAADEDVASPDTFYADDDGDGYGDPDTTVEACAAPTGYVSDSTDCDDLEADVNPDAAEVIDGQDNDCDGAGYHGDYSATASQSLAGSTYEYTSFSIGSSATVTVTGSSPLELYVLGEVDIDGELDLSGEDGESIRGMSYSAPAGGDGGGGGGGDGGDGSAYYISSYPYGPADDGDGDAPGEGGAGYSAGSGGGGGGQVDQGDDGGDAGGSCYGYVGGGDGGDSVNTTASPILIPGSGGGGGGYGTGYNSDGGGGGGGGGALYIEAEDIDISGEIYCYGGNGGGNNTSSCYHAGGGGGGSGGTLWFISDTLDVSGAIDCDGGSGGSAYYCGHCGTAGDGGDGADGLIYLDTDTLSVTGSVSPGYDTP